MKWNWFEAEKANETEDTWLWFETNKLSSGRCSLHEIETNDLVVELKEDFSLMGYHTEHSNMKSASFSL